MVALVFFLGLIAVGVLGADHRVRFGWAVVVLVALMALRVSQPVTYVVGTEWDKVHTQE